ncbi:MAG: hypothetical protein MJ095_07935 [Oscillospiraceae bacterium]|nr:hypothetical protein [Oscillospiraceae bacterium]
MKTKFDIKKSEIYARNIICGLMAVIMGFLLAESFMHSMILSNTEEMFEGISYHHDNFIFNFIYMAAVLLVSGVLIPKLEKIPVKLVTGILIAETLIFGIWWVVSSQASPWADQYVVSRAARMAAQNDFSFMSPDDRYFSNYPFQLGMVLFYEIQVRLFGGMSDTLIYTQIINVFYLAAAYTALILILGKLFKKKRIQILAAVTMMFSVQPLLYTTFIYAVIPGIANVLWALYFEIKYFETENKKKYIWAALSVFFIAFSVMVKTNNLIALIALSGTAFVKFIPRRKISDIIYIAVMLVCSLNILSAVTSSYEHRSNTKLEPAVPMIGYVAMGLNDPEGVLGCNAMGWYSSRYTTSNYAGNNYDLEKTKEYAMTGVKEALGRFTSDYGYANDFFYEKNTSQWNEPTYSCFWINLVMSRYNGVQPGKLCSAVLEANAGKSRSGLLEYMNVYQLFIYLAVFAGVFVCFREKNLLCSAMLLIVLGAFLYHMIFEGKSQYIMPYFIILTGFSAVGTDLLLTKISEFRNGRNKAPAADSSTAE